MSNRLKKKHEKLAHALLKDMQFNRNHKALKKAPPTIKQAVKEAKAARDKEEIQKRMWQNEQELFTKQRIKEYKEVQRLNIEKMKAKGLILPDPEVERLLSSFAVAHSSSYKKAKCERAQTGEPQRADMTSATVLFPLQLWVPPWLNSFAKTLKQHYNPVYSSPSMTSRLPAQKQGLDTHEIHSILQQACSAPEGVKRDAVIGFYELKYGRKP